VFVQTKGEILADCEYCGIQDYLIATVQILRIIAKDQRTSLSASLGYCFYQAASNISGDY
jgi:hypothetical protein